MNHYFWLKISNSPICFYVNIFCHPDRTWLCMFSVPKQLMLSSCMNTWSSMLASLSAGTCAQTDVQKVNPLSLFSFFLSVFFLNNFSKIGAKFRCGLTSQVCLQSSRAQTCGGALHPPAVTEEAPASLCNWIAAWCSCFCGLKFQETSRFSSTSLKKKTFGPKVWNKSHHSAFPLCHKDYFKNKNTNWIIHWWWWGCWWCELLLLKWQSSEHHLFVILQLR